MTAAEIRSVGVTLNKTSGERNFEIYTTKSVPKTLSDFESYSMIFADGKLVKIWGVSQNLINDPAGIKSKERFENLRAALTEKYGKPTHNYQKIGMKLYKEYDEFYQCLAYAGCGIWGSSFETPDKSITIEIKGLQRGVGYIDVTAEAKPQFDLSLGVYKSRGAKSDKDAI